MPVVEMPYLYAHFLLTIQRTPSFDGVEWLPGRY